MRVAIGCDHGGFDLKMQLAEALREMNHDVVDVGAMTYDKEDDYPDAAFAVAEAVVNGQAERGVAICGSGVGVCIAANKVPGARAAVCHDNYTAHQGVEHDDMNILCLGGRVIGPTLAEELMATFLGATFVGEERFRRRVRKVLEREDRRVR